MPGEHRRTEGQGSVPGTAALGGRLSAVVAEIEMEEFERVARVVPVFLWLWEHRDEVRRLLAQGASWQALAAALGRLGLEDLGGGAPRQEYCRAAWARVVAFEALVPRGQAERRPLDALAEPAFEPDLPATAVPAPPLPAGAAPAAAPSLNAILARGRRTALTEPEPLDTQGRARRPAAQTGDKP
jgi:hypothetical protein